MTLTGSPNRPNPFGDRVAVAPFNFDRPDELRKSLEGASVLINTYWVRFARGRITHEMAVENTARLFNAARDAGVRKIVHISITSADARSPLPYFRGKVVLEERLRDLGVPYAIIRPTVVFSNEDILINNRAWGLRHFPVFPIFGKGDYKVQPVHVEDVAEIAVNASKAPGNQEIDAVGPETFTYEELARLIARHVNRRRGKRALWPPFTWYMHVSPGLGYRMTQIVGWLVRDIVLEPWEIEGLMGLLVSNSLPTGKTVFSDWLAANADSIGRRYVSEVKKNHR